MVHAKTYLWHLYQKAYFMRLTEKQRQVITQNLGEITNGTFEEIHIKELFLDIREFVGLKSLTRELGHFMAHYQRNTGIYHALLNARAATFDLVISNPASAQADYPVLEIDLKKINEKFYETIFITALNRNHRMPLPNASDNLNVADTTAFLKTKYTKSGKFYVLKDISALPLIYEIAMSCLCRFDGLPLMSQDELIEGLNDEIKHFCTQHLPRLNFGNTIRRRGAEITLCILSLLQNATFILYDGTEATFQLRILGNSMASTYEEAISGMTRLAIVGGRLENGTMRPSIQYIDSNAEPRANGIIINQDNYLYDVGLVQAKRDNQGILKLFSY